MNSIFRLALICGLFVNCVISEDTEKKHKQDSVTYDIVNTNGYDINIDDNWLNEVLNTNVNESSKKYNQIIIDQEPKHVQLPRLVSDDEDNVDGSGSGDGIQLDKEKNEGGHFTEQTPGRLEQQTIGKQHEAIRRLPDPNTDVDLFNVDNEETKETLRQSATIGAATIPTTRVVTKTSTTQSNIADISKEIETDDEVDDEDGDDFIEARTELGSGLDDEVSDDEEKLNITSPMKTEDITRDEYNCRGISCKYGATCLIQNGVKTGCVCGMKCENFKGNPVCGSDGILYENLCHLQLEACSLQVNISLDSSDKCLQNDNNPFNSLQQCKTSYPYWTPWSLWIQSGDKEFRFRYCKRSGSYLLADDSCNDPQMQVRQCNRRETRACRSMSGKTTQEYEYSCSGVQLSEISRIDDIFPHLHDEVSDCEYSLYDIGIAKFIHKKWTIDDLDAKGDKNVWCRNRDRFVPFFDSTNSVLRFAQDDTYIGSTSRKAFYGTVYDTKQQIPLMSFGRLRNLSDTSKPLMKFMIEKGLVSTKKHKSVVSTVYNWLNGAEGKGMFYDNGEISVCNLGQFQAVNTDYDTSEYKMQQLLPHSLTGNDVREKIATYTLTNTAPIHTSLHGMWETALSTARTFAVEKCGIPVLLNPVRRQRNRVSRDHPEMYVISGAVSLNDADNTIGNGVAVPYLFWFAGCCIKGADTASYALYARNVPDSVVISAPVAQLEILLSDIYNITSNKTIKLFPAYDDICGSIKSDISGQIKL
ncbi:unnamed protein product [Mytilus coruscus]|uniref:Kazal-like domain-containing protein n=1 Tax=Mytilus coruscus TaxID=42192 RepID=A0A6J8C131_MYTCO|nr:unnamed protein product [Mytilus coruscus]